MASHSLEYAAYRPSPGTTRERRNAERTALCLSRTRALATRVRVHSRQTRRTLPAAISARAASTRAATKHLAVRRRRPPLATRATRRSSPRRRRHRIGDGYDDTRAAGGSSTSTPWIFSIALATRLSLSRRAGGVARAKTSLHAGGRRGRGPPHARCSACFRAASCPAIALGHDRVRRSEQASEGGRRRRSLFSRRRDEVSRRVLSRAARVDTLSMPTASVSLDSRSVLEAKRSPSSKARGQRTGETPCAGASSATCLGSPSTRALATEHSSVAASGDWSRVARHFPGRVRCHVGSMARQSVRSSAGAGRVLVALVMQFFPDHAPPPSR